MQITQENAAAASTLGVALPESGSAARSPYADYKVIRRNGAVVGFEPGKIAVAMTKAFLAVNGAQGAASARIRTMVADLTENVVNALLRRQPQGGTFHIEDIQDQVELALMRSGEHDVARAYVLYREKRAQARAQESAQKKSKAAAKSADRKLAAVARSFDFLLSVSPINMSEAAERFFTEHASRWDEIRWPTRQELMISNELLVARGIVPNASVASRFVQ